MDAFALDWTDLYVYAFSPVQVVLKSDAKTEKRKAQNGFDSTRLANATMVYWGFSLANDYFSGKEVSNQAHMVEDYVALHM